MIRRAVTTRNETNLVSNCTFKSPRISLESRFESSFYTRRLGPHESRYFRRFENRDLGRLHGIRRKNRPKRFRIENDSRKGGTIPGRSCHRPATPVLGSSSAKELDYPNFSPEHSPFHAKGLKTGPRERANRYGPLFRIITD